MWSGDCGGTFTSWYVSQESHGSSPWTLGGDDRAQGALPPHEGQVRRRAHGGEQQEGLPGGGGFICCSLGALSHLLYARTQVPCMATKWDVLTRRRDVMCVGGEDGVPNISLYNTGWFRTGEHHGEVAGLDGGGTEI